MRGKKLCIQHRIRVLNTIRVRIERNSFATWNPFHLTAMAPFEIEYYSVTKKQTKKKTKIAESYVDSIHLQFSRII